MTDPKGTEEEKKTAPEEPVTDPDAEGDEPEAEGKVDYKAEAEKLRAIASRQAGAIRELRKERKAEAEEEPDDKEEIHDGNVAGIVRQELSRIERQRVDGDIEDTLDELTNDPDERELIKLLYETKLSPSGFSKRALREDLMSAKLLANKDKFMAKAEANVRKGMASRAAMMTAGMRPAAKVNDEAPKTVTREEARFLKKWGINPNDVK